MYVIVIDHLYNLPMYFFTNMPLCACIIFVYLNNKCYKKCWQLKMNLLIHEKLWTESLIHILPLLIFSL